MYNKRILILALLFIVILINGCMLKQKSLPEEKVQPQQEQIEQQPQSYANENVQETEKRVDEMQIKKWRQVKVPCNGDFFDSHIHFDALLTNSNQYMHQEGFSLTSKELATRMGEHKVGCGVMFVSIFDINKQFDSLRENLSGLNVGFIPFFSIFNPSLSSIQAMYVGREGTFFGIGEIGFYEGPLLGTSLAEDPWPAIFEYAAKENLFLMLHPTQKQANDLEKMLARYPDTKVILHGYELLNTGLVEDWLRSYKNLYWTYDLATMLDGYMYRVQNADDFVMWYDANKKQYLASVSNKLLPLLEAAPERVMWGTDVVAAWHMEPEVYNRLMEFSYELVDSLPSKHRANYAHDNAQRIFDSGIIFEQLQPEPKPNKSVSMPL